MKKFLSAFLFFVVPLLCLSAQDSNPNVKETILNQKDSVFIEHIDNAIMQSGYVIPRYKLYKTENIYHVLKLDTATGKIWQIQIGINDNPRRMIDPINIFSLIDYSEGLRNGRFELCPTGNIYNFVLIDTQRGYTYQVQWNTDPDKRFIVEIE